MTVVLKLYTDQSFYFLSPTEPCSDPLPTAIVPPEEQVCISGVLSLRVSLRPRTIKHLSITFDSSFNVLMPMSERKRSKSLQHQYLQLKTNGPQLYPVGEHLFAFTFFVPQSTAPSDESLDVSVRHRLRAKAVATGTFNDKMHEAVLPVRLVGNANALSCEMPEPLLCHVESYSDYLGPYTCELISDSLTVGSM